MTQPNPATKTRADIARALAEFLKTAVGAVHLVRVGIGLADGQLRVNGYVDDHRWLCEHYSRVRSDDLIGVTALAHRLVERLTIEGDAVGDESSRAVDLLIADTARHLTKSGDRAAIVAHMLSLDHGVLANLTADALIRLSDRDRLIETNFQLSAQVEIEQAKAVQA